MADVKRDYSTLGPSARRAVEIGLASAEWYHSDLSREQLKQLMTRSDHPAVRDTLIWLACLIGFASIGIALWPSWWSAPFWLAYGVLYGSAGDSRWHECGHGTAFRTRWMNRVVYQIASFMMVRNPIAWRWSHSRHHSETIVVGRDPEIALMRPPNMLRLMSNFVGLSDSYHGLKNMLNYALGRIEAEHRDYIPEPEQQKAINVARVWCVIYAAVIGLAVWMGSILPLMVIGLPRLYGAWHHVMTGLLQHGGLAENVTDHRLNTRTVYMNPISRFIYWNMNYHVEHHMFPMVPYFALPKLHELIKDDLPAPNRSVLEAYREMWPALVRQLRYEDYFLVRELPKTAKPYRDEFHALG